MVRPGIMTICGLLALGACGPVPVGQAERSCVQRANDALGPRSNISLGVVGDRHGIRPTSSVSVAISTDALAGRDPSEVFNRCVIDRSGQFPTRQLTDQPGWRG